MDATTKIFIVEDDLFYGSMLFDIFENKNFKKVKRIDSGQKCLDSLHENPDIIVLDYHLGDMTGIDVLKKIKIVNPKIEVIFMSAQEQLNTAIKSLEYGAYDYLEKSNSNIELLIIAVKKIAYERRLIA